MKIAGIIVEYNPLHNGHVYHIQQTRALSGCDCLIAVMSSHFTQRGEPTIVDKFTRTKWALSAGVDLVVELPFVLGVQSADLFAQSSVELLNHLGVTDIYFGSEAGDIKSLETMGDMLATPTYNDLVQTHLKAGYSYPTANDMAMKELIPDNAFDQPNNILGIQYILAGKAIDPSLTFHTIQRIKTGYYDAIDASSSIQSATAIRALALSQQPINDYVPSLVASDLSTTHLVTYDDFALSLSGILHRASAKDLEQLFHVTEGLEHRIKQVTSFDTIADLTSAIISKRYTHAKLQRMFAHILCNVKKTDILDRSIPYLRILGMNDQGRAHLNNIKKIVSVPLYTKIKEGLHPYLDIELRVTKVYNIASDIDLYKQEFEPVIF